MNMRSSSRPAGVEAMIRAAAAAALAALAPVPDGPPGELASWRAFEQWLDHRTVYSGVVEPELAERWGAPACAGRRTAGFSWRSPPSRPASP